MKEGSLKRRRKDDLIDFDSLKTTIESTNATDYQKRLILRHLRSNVFSERNIAYRWSEIFFSIADIAFKLKNIDPLGFSKLIKSIKSMPSLTSS